LGRKLEIATEFDMHEAHWHPPPACRKLQQERGGGSSIKEEQRGALEGALLELLAHQGLEIQASTQLVSNEKWQSEAFLV
jgi:hypothetical protein